MIEGEAPTLWLDWRCLYRRRAMRPAHSCYAFTKT